MVLNQLKAAINGRGAGGKTGMCKGAAKSWGQIGGREE